MPYRDVFVQNRGMGLLAHVDNGEILNIGPRTDPDIVDIPAYYGPEPDVRVLSKLTSPIT